MTTELALALGAAVSSGFGLWRYWLRLRFLRDVYNKGGVDDLKVAAEAVQGPVRDVASSFGNGVRQRKSVAPPDDEASK